MYRASDPEDRMIEGLTQRAIDDLIARFGTTAYRQFALRLADVDPATRARLVELAGRHEEP